MNGCTGKSLVCDLSSGVFSTEEVDEQIYREYLGGRGLASKLFYEKQAGSTDPLSPENLIIIATGLFTGTPIPASSKFLFITKSPATGAFLESYSSGDISFNLKYAGYDNLLIKGECSVPSVLVIDDDSFGIVDASDLWGLNSFETERRLKNRLGSDFGLITIGPAGERQLSMAAVCSNFYRHAARGGGGSVMGSKKLKAIAVRGTKVGIACHDFKGLLNLQKKHQAQLKENHIGKIRKKYGSPYTLEITNRLGMLPTRNFQSGTYEKAIGTIDSDSVASLTIKDKSCMGCIEACSKINRISSGEFEGLTLEGPEYETIGLFGSNHDVDDIRAIIKANELCDYYGLDTISVAVSIGFVMECFERKLLQTSDTGGLDLRFGNTEAVNEAIKQIALEEGFGVPMGKGVRYLSEQVGQDSENFAMHVKGLEFPAYEPRANFAAGLTYAVTPRGACHRRCWPAARDTFGDDPFTGEGKASLVKDVWDKNSIYHSILICDFLPKHMNMSLDDVGFYIHALTGVSYSVDDLYTMADKTESTIRRFNCREGFSRADDTLPGRILNEALAEGPPKGKILGKHNLDIMLDEYYALRGWDGQGNPPEAGIS